MQSSVVVTCATGGLSHVPVEVELTFPISNSSLNAPGLQCAKSSEHITPGWRKRWYVHLNCPKHANSNAAQGHRFAPCAHRILSASAESVPEHCTLRRYVRRSFWPCINSIYSILLQLHPSSWDTKSGASAIWVSRLSHTNNF